MNKNDMKRKSAFINLYGITLEEYNRMLESQGGVCAICGNVNENGHALSVDHDHESGKVRGLLCAKCNYALGYINDNQEIAIKIVEYLEVAKRKYIRYGSSTEENLTSEQRAAVNAVKSAFAERTA